MKTTPLTLRIALPVPLRQVFDYLPPDDCDIHLLKPGVRIKVPFQNRELVGFFLETTDTPDVPWHKLKQAFVILDSSSLFPNDIWQLCTWAAQYYHYPLGEVLALSLPAFLRQGKPALLHPEIYWVLTAEGRALTAADLKRSPRQWQVISQLSHYPNGISTKALGVAKSILNTLNAKKWVEQIEIGFPATTKEIRKEVPLNSDQQKALEAIQHQSAGFQVFLLDGVTGSGKTEVYLQIITEYLNQQKQVLVLVPEIGLTPQTIQRFRERFAATVVALNSSLSEKERLNAWVAAKTGQAKIIIGTRSAVFTPFADLGLIIIDEEHDLSFKQQDTFRYHARDLSIMRAHFNKIPIILGSATPSLETLHKAQTQRYQHLRLPKRAGGAQSPDIQILDIRKAPLEQGLSQSLLHAMGEQLNLGNQVMLFLNRRGFSPIMMCHACGWTATCKRCDTRMTYHQYPERLHCHHCDTRRHLVEACQGCGRSELIPVGLGTERLEDALTKHFPHASIARIDRDTTQRKGTLEETLEKILQGEHHLLIGTQMLAKGHHFPNVTLVGVVDTDGGFFSSDFRSLERMGQLLLQVSGRAGRAEKPGKVIIQTRHPDHPLLHQLLKESYYHYGLTLLKEREQAQLPPFTYFALFRAEAYDLVQARSFLQKIKELATPFNHFGVTLQGPVTAPMPKRASLHRVQLLIHSTQRPALQALLKNLIGEIEKLKGKHKVQWSLDVDPLEMV